MLPSDSQLTPDLVAMARMYQTHYEFVRGFAKTKSRRLRFAFHRGRWQALHRILA